MIEIEVRQVLYFVGLKIELLLDPTLPLIVDAKGCFCITLTWIIWFSSFMRDA